MRPIDANALPYVPAIVGDEGGWTEEIIAIPKSAVDDAPTLDYAPVRHGEWIMVSEDGTHGVCNVCNRSDGIDSLATHCRYCGARMDGKEEE